MVTDYHEQTEMLEEQQRERAESVTKIDKLFALGALEKRVQEELELLKGECANDLEEAYKSEGTTQRRSPLFGKEAGTFSIAFKKATEPTQEIHYTVKDMTKLAKWCEDNRLDVDAYIQANAEAFTTWLVDYTGEIPEGVEREVIEIPGMPETPSGVRLSVKPDIVFPQIGGAQAFDRVNRIMLGVGYE